MNILWDHDPGAPEKYRFALGGDVTFLESAAAVGRAVQEHSEINLVVIGPEVALDSACDLAEALSLDRPHVGVVVLRHRLEVNALSQAQRAGVREVVGSEDLQAVADAVRRSHELTARLTGATDPGGGGRHARVITVFSAKGGVGKTTLSTNLAVHFAATGAKTLLIDLDLAFGDVAISLQLLPSSSIADVASMSGHLDPAGLASLVVKHAASGLDVVAAPQDPAQADRVPVSSIAELLRVARTEYDYVFIDTPPSFTEHVLAAFDGSDLSVLIATLDIPAVKNLRLALDTLDLLGHPADSRVIVLNRADAKVGLRAEDVETVLKRPIGVSVPNSLDVPASINRGDAIVLTSPKHPVSAALRSLAERHLRVEPLSTSSEEPSRRGRGLLRSRR
ncbi:chromosome partitioning protein [Knoellia sinensis KCTC 19936]|uniref:Chromosome partitioning protein n=1 Tax=Knoellia sinensis KCTC 19936 TaxID=1385520 RepID=A0A0A0J8G1_9MICO|nr:AAA family ATPase [Knoellia sinensis]KGN32347.1 chromosome partitioning protein [Knoellia sinensis KCTC 19936]